jgi:hypothetical protein
MTINSEKIKTKKTTPNIYIEKDIKIIGRNLKAITAKTNPVITSTKGYWCDILLAQRRHLPD